MAHHLASIECNPSECSVREVIDVVPAELLREETAHTSQPAYLRDLGRVTKSIRKPKGGAPLAKMALEEPLTIEKLSYQRLSTRHVCIMFNPTATNRLEMALLHPFLNPIEH